MKKAKINSLITLALGLFCTATAVQFIIRDLDINLSKAKSTTGQIAYCDTRSIDFGLRYRVYKRIFYFKLNNSDQRFAIYRPDANYDDLTWQIKTGDTVKVYYRPSINDYNIHVFQVEKGSKVVASYYDYNKEASPKAGILLFAGVVITAFAIMRYRNFNILSFMNRIAQDRQDKQQPT